jgi:hypothetical protein
MVVEKGSCRLEQKEEESRGRDGRRKFDGQAWLVCVVCACGYLASSRFLALTFCASLCNPACPPLIDSASVPLYILWY